MSSSEQALPAVAHSRTLDDASVWFWQFLKTELAPYPGRLWVVSRMVISATIIMLLVMTFRIPFGFLAAVYTMFLSRENPQATLRSAVRVTFMYVAATAYTIAGVMLFVGSPITHFLWIASSIFLAFYAVRVMPDYFTAVGFGFTLAGAIPLWDQTYLTVNTRTEDTLWLGGAVIMGSIVTVVVEYIFRRVHPASDLHIGISQRLTSLEQFLRQLADNRPVSEQVQKLISLYSSLGASRLRRQLVRSGYAPQFTAEMNTAVSLLGRLVDLAASLEILGGARLGSLSDSDRQRCRTLADQISALQKDLQLNRPPQLIDIPTQPQSSELLFLPEMERTVALITQVFSNRGAIADLPVPVATDDTSQPLFVSDMFTNPDHLKFATRGMLATMLAYMTYQAVAWPGLATSVATCIITALSTIGASRQKQFLRLMGAAIGGVIFGMGAQVFLLTHFDSITPFALLFAAVTAIAAWIQTATPRLSYLGVQMALAFYLINLQEFTIQSSLAVARDRVAGVLLGLICMWLVFDHLWVRSAVDEMRDAFAHNLRLLAELMEQTSADDRKQAMTRVAQLRDRINDGFLAVKAQSDAILFEFGGSRPAKLHMRENIRRWQPTIGTLLQVQVTYAQYELQVPLPDEIRQAHRAFQDDVIRVVRAMADELSGRVCPPAPDVRQSAATLRARIENYFRTTGVPQPPRATDVMTLTDNLGSILAPLYQDMHAAFVRRQQEQQAGPHGELRDADATS